MVQYPRCAQTALFIFYLFFPIFNPWIIYVRVPYSHNTRKSLQDKDALIFIDILTEPKNANG